MKKRLLILLMIFLTSCSVPQQVSLLLGLEQQKPITEILSVPLPGRITPTPFQPLPITPTYIPTEYPTPTNPPPTITPTLGFTGEESRNWGDYPGPTIWPDITVPAPTGLLSQPVGQTNILLLGSDQRPNTGGFRTDTMVLLTLNPSQGTANMTVFPRDLYVYIPGWTVQRINTAHAYGGFNLTALTFEYNFGVRPDHYVLVNMGSFREVIFSLNGIDVNVGKTLVADRGEYGVYTVNPGMVHMDGDMALWYVRSRKSTSDFDRGRRQLEVLEALFRKLISKDALTKAPELYKKYRDTVVTDMSFEQMTEYLPLASILKDTSQIQPYAIGPQQVTPWVNYSGAQVLLPIRQAVMDVMRQALNTP